MKNDLEELIRLTHIRSGHPAVIRQMENSIRVDARPDTDPGVVVKYRRLGQLAVPGVSDTHAEQIGRMWMATVDGRYSPVAWQNLVVETVKAKMTGPECAYCGGTLPKHQANAKPIPKAEPAFQEEEPLPAEDAGAFSEVEWAGTPQTSWNDEVQKMLCDVWTAHAKGKANVLFGEGGRVRIIGSDREQADLALEVLRKALRDQNQPFHLVIITEDSGARWHRIYARLQQITADLQDEVEEVLHFDAVRWARECRFRELLGELTELSETLGFERRTKAALTAMGNVLSQEKQLTEKPAPGPCSTCGATVACSDPKTCPFNDANYPEKEFYPEGQPGGENYDPKAGEFLEEATSQSEKPESSVPASKPTVRRGPSKKEVKIGQEYVANVSGRSTRVRIEEQNENGSWRGTNLKTNREIHIASAQRLSFIKGRKYD